MSMQRSRLAARALPMGLVLVLLGACAGPDAGVPETSAGNRSGSSSGNAGGAAAGGGIAVVTVGNDRYQATGLRCRTSSNGEVEAEGPAVGPRPNAVVTLRFGSPGSDFVGVAFDGSSLHEFAALNDKRNWQDPRGVLASCTFDEGTKVASGEAEFVRTDEDMVQHDDDLIAGSFELRC